MSSSFPKFSHSFDQLVTGLCVVKFSVIILVINKLDSRFAVVQICKRNHLYDYRPN